MSDSNVSAQLIRLQNALLEGRIDRSTYEQLKSDLLNSVESAVEPSASRESAPPHPPVEPPSENPFKKKAEFPRVVKTVKFRDLTQPPTAVAAPVKTAPAAIEKPVTRESTPEQRSSTSTGIGGTRPVMTPLPVKERPPRATAGSAAPTVDGLDRTEPIPLPDIQPNSSYETVKRSLREPQTWKQAGEIAAHCGIVLGLRAWAMNRSTVLAALFWGVESAIHGGAGILVHDACLDFRSRKHDAIKMGLVQFAWTLLLLIAASFWVYVGILYGGLVGSVLGGRFGFLTAAGGEMVGGMIGLVKAIQGYRNSREQLEDYEEMSDDDDEDEEDDDER